jgi:hypothetical protein
MRGRVAFALALGVGAYIVALGCGTLWAIIDDSQTVTSEITSLVSAIVGGVVGALAVYLGGETPPPPPREPEPWSDSDTASTGDYPEP